MSIYSARKCSSQLREYFSNHIFSVCSTVKPCCRIESLTAGGSSGPSSLTQQENQWEQEQEAAEPDRRWRCCSDWVIIRWVGVQSRSVPTTLSTHTRPTPWAADVITWRHRQKEWLSIFNSNEENNIYTFHWNNFFFTNNFSVYLLSVSTMLNYLFFKQWWDSLPVTQVSQILLEYIYNNMYYNNMSPQTWNMLFSFKLDLQ